MENNDSIRVLAVDDEQDIRDGSERILTRIGYEVIKAENGNQALEILDQTSIAIVLLDLKMPGMDGLEVLDRIRKMDPSIIVIVITGYATVETAIEAMKQGAYDFISKPFEPDQLRIVVNRAAEKIRLQRKTELAERERQRTLADLDTEKSRIRTIIESLPGGVLVTNAKGQVVLINPFCRQLLNLPPDLPLGSPISDYIEDSQLCQLIMEISSGKHVDFEDIEDYEFSPVAERYLVARAQPVLGDHKECLGAVVNLSDITEMKILDRMKSEFVAKVSHELRSPLSTIHEQLAVVIRDMVGSSEQDQYLLTRAKEKTQGLISLISDLLDLSRIEEGLICHTPKLIQPTEVLKNVVDFLSTRAESKNQQLTLTLPPTAVPEMMADPIALESIFGNLITNAINYTPEGGNIRVESELVGNNLRVRVIDNGFGIAEKHLPRIFERFYRVKDHNTRFITGTGLGLPIVKGLVDSMNGYIEVESEPGKGTTFTVLLPIK